jgi:thymidylate synthase (FAD)
MTKLFVFDYETPKLGFVSLVDKMTHDTALKVVNAARTSYGNTQEEFTDKDSKLTKYLWQHEHTSPFRHSFYTFCVKAPLFTFRQWVKYQVGSAWRSYELDGQEIEIFDHQFDTDKGCSWNEASGRYMELEAEFWFPGKVRTNKKQGSKQSSEELDCNHALLISGMESEAYRAYAKYKRYIEMGMAKEQARTMLPQSIYTTAYWTVSLQGAMHFLHQRLKPDAQEEIRMYAEGIYELLKPDITRMGITKEELIDE